MKHGVACAGYALVESVCVHLEFCTDSGITAAETIFAAIVENQGNRLGQAQRALGRSWQGQSEDRQLPQRVQGSVVDEDRVCPRLGQRDRVETDPLADRRSQDVDGELGVDERPLRGVELGGDAGGRVDAGHEPLHRRHLLAGDEVDTGSHPDDAGAGLGGGALGPPPLDHVEVPARPALRAGVLHPVGRGVPGWFGVPAGAVDAGREAPGRGGRHRSAALLVVQRRRAQLDAATGADDGRLDGQRPHRHRPEELDGQPSEDPVRTGVEPLDRPGHEGRRRAAVLALTAPRTGRRGQ